MNRIVIGVNSFWNIYNFRINLIKMLIYEGFEVHIISTVEDINLFKNISDLPISIHHITLDRYSKNVFGALSTILQYYLLQMH